MLFFIWWPYTWGIFQMVLSALPKCITLHFSGWNFKSHLSDHTERLSKSFWRISWSSGLFIMLKILVSANIYTSDSMLDGKSFIYSTNKIGPGTLPCGMPLVTGFQVILLSFYYNIYIRVIPRQMSIFSEIPTHFIFRSCSIFLSGLANYPN